MKNYLTSTLALLIAISLSACASFQRSMIAGEEQKTVYYPNIKDAGDFYVVNFMNQKTSKIGLQILDRYKEPYYLNEESIKAFIQRQNGENEIVYLQGEGYIPDLWEGENLGNGASIYSKRMSWVKNEHLANIHVWIPMPDNEILEFDFNCVARKHESMQNKKGTKKNKLR